MEIVIIAVLAAWFGYAVHSIRKGKTGCCGDCKKCHKKCDKETDDEDTGVG